MARGWKFVVVVDEVSSRGTADEKGKRINLRTRETMNFDPKSRVLRSQQEVVKYLAMYDICLLSNIEVKWCPTETDITVSLLSAAYIFTPRS